jgi:hypothetical protein
MITKLVILLIIMFFLYKIVNLSLASVVILGIFAYVFIVYDYFKLSKYVTPIKNQFKLSIITSNDPHYTEYKTGNDIDIYRDGTKAVFIGTGVGSEDVLLIKDNTTDTYQNIISKTNLSSKHKTYGSIVYDLDGDGYDDLLVAREDGVYLYKNEKGTGKFTVSLLHKNTGNEYPIGIVLARVGDNKVLISQIMNKTKKTNGSLPRGDIVEGFDEETHHQGNNKTYELIMTNDGKREYSNILQVDDIDRYITNQYVLGEVKDEMGISIAKMPIDPMDKKKHIMFVANTKVDIDFSINRDKKTIQIEKNGRYQIDLANDETLDYVDIKVGEKEKRLTDIENGMTIIINNDEDLHSGHLVSYYHDNRGQIGKVKLDKHIDTPLRNLHYDITGLDIDHPKSNYVNLMPDPPVNTTTVSYDRGARGVGFIKIDNFEYISPIAIGNPAPDTNLENQNTCVKSQPYTRLNNVQNAYTMDENKRYNAINQMVVPKIDTPRPSVDYRNILYSKYNQDQLKINQEMN